MYWKLVYWKVVYWKVVLLEGCVLEACVLEASSQKWDIIGAPNHSIPLQTAINVPPVQWNPPHAGPPQRKHRLND